MLQWNTDLVETHKLQILDEHSDIVYQVFKEAAGGLISRRELVSIRHWKIMDDNSYFIALKKTDHPAKPILKSNKYVRYDL